jgi:hypothetical protein
VDQYSTDQYTQESYRVPDARRPADPGVVLGPRSGVELPPLPFATEPPGYAPEAYPMAEPGAVPLPPPEPEPGAAPRGGHHSERTTVRRAGGAGSHSGLYFARRAGLVGVLTALAVVAELLLIRVLVTGEFGHTVVPGSVLGSMCAMAGIPLVTIGLYGVMTGMPAAAPRPAVAWARAPLAYLPVGLVLLLAASLAVR